MHTLDLNIVTIIPKNIVTSLRKQEPDMHIGAWVSLVLSLVLALGGCGRMEGAPPATRLTTTGLSPENQEVLVDGHNSRNALDWVGTYSGVLPCASCPGIETTISLQADGSYQRTLNYLEEGATQQLSSGHFTWDRSGRRITLAAGSEDAEQYQVAEDRLFRLDREGRRIQGDLASHYVLHKHLGDTRIENRLWELVELHGRPVAAGPAALRPTLILRNADSSASGRIACNSYQGGYVIKSGNRIAFDWHLAVTMMACPAPNIEAEFLDVLRSTDNYTVSDDGIFNLNRARMAPLARFAPAIR